MPQFDGATYVESRDGVRLNPQLEAVRDYLIVLHPNAWCDLREIVSYVREMTGSLAGEASVTARIRDLRKQKFGGYKVASRFKERGIWEYQLTVEGADAAFISNDG